MPPGRPPLDAETKAKRRQESLQRYALKNQESLRAAARTRMQALRGQATEEEVKLRRRRAQASGAKYREGYGLSRRRHRRRSGGGLRGDASSRSRKRPRARAPHPFLRHRYDPKEVLTQNQKRCRALRASGLEEDNGEDSDADIPPGMCGCDMSECQLPHKNETAKRKDWKIFHLKYAKELAE
ncbi:hypothetical protein C8R46DRAFT_1033681 [Mycena filopes]|nr:hypothetical protein C8R46DRAFT_1033681 [Mycena filopes]